MTASFNKVRVYLEEYGAGESPDTPDSGEWALFFRPDGIYIKDDGGSITGPLGVSGGWDGDIADIDLDGGDDIGAALADGDLILVDDGAGGTNRKSAISRLWTYISSKFEETPDYSDISGNDGATDVTAAELEELSDGSETSLHSHAGWDGDIADIDLDGGVDIGAALADGDLFLVDDGAGGTNRKSAISRLWTYISSKFVEEPDYSNISGNDGSTDVTAAELEELSDGSETTLHSHAGGSSEMPKGHLHGLTLSNNGADATNDIDIAAGECRDSTGAEDMTLASALTKRLDAAWAVGTGNGGLDTGSIGNNTYFVWLIKRSDTGVVDALFSLSASSPTMPTNYDYKRRIGCIIRSSGTILAFIQDGDKFMLKSPVNSVNATNPGTSAVTRTLNTPVGVRLEAILFVAGYSTNAAHDPGSIYISDLSLTDVAPSIAVAATHQAFSLGTDVQIGAMLHVMTNTSAQVRSRLQYSDTTTVLVINTNGWIDRRGRLS